MKKILCFIISFFLVNNCVYAISFKCPEVASPGEVIYCHLEDEQYIGIKAKFQLKDGFSYNNLKLGTSWKSYYDGREGFSIGNVLDNNKLSSDVLIKVGIDTFVNQEYLIQLTDIEASDREDKVIKLDNVSSKVKIVSDINTIENLEISSGNLSPSFDKNVTSYQAFVNVDKIVIKAVATDKDSKLEGDIGERKLNYGVNHFVVKVTSVRGKVKEYHLYITRELKEVKKDSDITLKSLSLSKGNIDFKKDKFYYSTVVDYDVEILEVNAIANSKKARVVVEKTDKLVVGENLIKIIVIAEDGTSGTYLINVLRNRLLSSDATIKNLIVKDYNLSFNTNIYEYELLINDEDKLEIDLELNDNNAKYSIIGNNNLKNNSVIKIKVIAENGNEALYKIKVMKDREANSSSIIDNVKFVSLIGFIILIVITLLVKIFGKIIVNKKD